MFEYVRMTVSILVKQQLQLFNHWNLCQLQRLSNCYPKSWEGTSQESINLLDLPPPSPTQRCPLTGVSLPTKSLFCVHTLDRITIRFTECSLKNMCLVARFEINQIFLGFTLELRHHGS